MPPRLAGAYRNRAAALGTSTPASSCPDSPGSGFKVHGNELFDSPEPSNTEKRIVAEHKQPTEDLIKQAVVTHAETTRSANRALKVVEDTKDLHAATMKDLHRQHQTLAKINRHIDQANEDLSYSEKLLRYMSTCCCCWMFDSCTGLDPDQQRKKEWEKKVDRGETSATGLNSSSKTSAASLGTNTSSTPAPKRSLLGRNLPANSRSTAHHRDPDIRLPDSHGSTATKLQSETQQQNKIIDQIGEGLDHLMYGAHDMKDEVESQNREIDRVNNNLDNTSARIKNVNTKSLLGKMPGHKRK